MWANVATATSMAKAESGTRQRWPALLGGFNARGNDHQHGAVQQSPMTPYSRSVCAQRREAEVQGARKSCSGIDGHGACVEIDPDRVVSGAARDARDVCRP